MSNDVPATGAVGGAEVMRTLAARSIKAGRPLDWYEELYAAADAGAAAVPWDHGVPTSLLAQWLQRRVTRLAGGGRAVVIGCAYGDDAELVAAHGFETTAFDIAPSAIAAAQRRHPDSTVNYVEADLLALPDHWRRHFNLVVECTTVQSMPPQLHAPAAAAVASLCADGGTVVVIARMRTDPEVPGPPWLLAEDEIRQFAVDGVVLETLETVRAPGGTRWRAQLNRPNPRVSQPPPARRLGSMAMPVWVLVGLVDRRGWLLMQERDDNTPVDPNRWSLIGGAVEPPESTLAAARRELAEETAILTNELRSLGARTLPCQVHGEDHYELFTAPTSVTDNDVHCGEGRQIVFVDPQHIDGLDLTSATRALYPTVLAAHPDRSGFIG